MNGHDELRMMLGGYALGHLTPAEEDRVRAHLDGCAECRAELAEIQPVADRLGLVDPAAHADRPLPAPDLGDRISRAVADEIEREGRDDLATARDRRRRVARWGAVAAAAVLVAALAGGVVGRATVPQAAPVPTEPIAVEVEDGGVTVESAALVAHTWGVELRLVGEGFADGETFRAAFRTTGGDLVPAGEFRGVGDASMSCFLQSSVLREDVTEVVVTDDDGALVLASTLADG
ncbi:hypothetical protein GCM10009623_11930 [Nocardioides aestuarii]|uniref:Zf-HC2 domain-containing protein n=1 Tax=Nocardioides aestuarii TaxID=252231 RepID=A0ABW4TIY8_9ACTN